MGFVDAELSFLFSSASNLRLPAVILAHNATVSAELLSGFRHLSVSLRNSSNPHQASSGQLQQIAAAVSNQQARWVLIVTDALKPMEYWLWNLMARMLSSNAPLKAVKSLTLNDGGSIKSAGLQHQIAIIGDANTLTLPFMLHR